MTSDIPILYEFNIFIIQLYLQITNYAFTISSVQDAFLEHAETLDALQDFEIFLFPPFSYFQNVAITT